MKEKFVIQLILPLLLNIFGIFVNFYKVTYIDIILIGALGFAGNIAGFFTLFLDLGITQIHYQYTSKQDFYRFFGSYFTIKLCLIIGNYSLPCLIFLFINVDNPLIIQLIWLNLYTGIFYALSEIFVVNLRVRFKVLKVEIPNFIIQGINQFIQLYVIMNLILFENPVISITIVNLVAMTIRFGIFICLNLKESIHFKPKWGLIKNYFADSKSLIIQNILVIPCNFLGGILVGWSMGLEELAFYQLTYTYIIMILLLFGLSLIPIYDALFPTLFAKKDTQSIQYIISQVERYSSILYLFFVIFVLLYSEILFGLFFPTYLPAVKYLKWLIPIPFLDSILNPYYNNLVQAKKQALSAKISIFNNILNIFLLIVIVPKLIFGVQMAGLGIWGVIIVLWILAIWNNLVLRYCSKKFFKLSSTVKYWKHFLNSGVSFTLIFGLNQIISIFISNTLYLFIISFCLFVLTYFALFYLSREFTISDLKFIRSLMVPSNYIRTLKDELKSSNISENS